MRYVINLITYYLLGTVGDTLVLADFFIQLQLSLDVLGRVGDAIFDSSRDAAGDDPFQEGIGATRLGTHCSDRGCGHHG